MSDQSISVDPVDQSRTCLAMGQQLRDAIIQYILAAPSPSGVSVSTANGLCETLSNLHVVTIVSQKPTSDINSEGSIKV